MRFILIMKRSSAQAFADDHKPKDDNIALSTDVEHSFVSITSHRESLENLEAKLERSCTPHIPKCSCNPYSSFTRAGPFILGDILNVLD